MKKLSEAYEDAATCFRPNASDCWLYGQTQKYSGKSYREWQTEAQFPGITSLRGFIEALKD